MSKRSTIKAQAIGINGLVRLSKLVSGLGDDAKFKFRALNSQYKTTLAENYLIVLKQSCRDKGRIMRPKGHELIGSNLVVSTGGLGRGVSAFKAQVDGVASLFAKIYDQGGTIIPKRGTRYLAVPTMQSRNLSLNLKGLPPRELLAKVQSQGIKTTTIKLTRQAQLNDFQLQGVGLYDEKSGRNVGHTGKLIIGRLKQFTGGKVSYKQIGLVALITEVKIKPSHWLRDGTEAFITNKAVPLLTNGAKLVSQQLKAKLSNVS